MSLTLTYKTLVICPILNNEDLLYRAWVLYLYDQMQEHNLRHIHWISPLPHVYICYVLEYVCDNLSLLSKSK